MAATPIVMALQEALPVLGWAAATIIAICWGPPTAQAVQRYLDALPAQRGNVKKQAYYDMGQAIREAMDAVDAKARLAENGWTSTAINAKVTVAVAERVTYLNTPTNLPTFNTIQSAVDYWGQQFEYLIQGQITDEYMSAVTTWCNAEITRIALAAAAAPPVTPGPVVVPGALYQPGTILFAPTVAWYYIVLSVTLINGVITYQVYNLAQRQTYTMTQDQMSVWDFAVVTSLPLADPAAVNAQIEALNLQIAALNLQMLSLTQDLSNALAALASSARVVTVTAPDVTVNAGDITVQAAPAPNVSVTPTLGVAGVEALLGALPLTLSASLVSAWAANAGNISHQGALGRNACYGSTAAALLANMLPTALGIFSMRVLQSDTGIGGWVKDRATDWIDGVVDPRKYKHVDTIDDLVDNASKKLTEAMSFGLQAHMWAVTAESNFVLKNLGLGQVAGYMADMAGFQRLAQATIGAVEAAALSIPARQLANRQLRPNIPDVGRALSLYAQRELEWSGTPDEPGAYDIIALNGLSDSWASIYQDEAYRHPGIRELLRNVSYLSFDAVPGLESPPSDVAEYLTNAGYPPSSRYPIVWPYQLSILKSGYHPAYVPWMTALVQRATARSEKAAYIAAAQKLRRDGYITSQRMTELILEAWQLTDPVSARVEVAEMEAEYKVLSDTRAVIVLSMAKGLITRDEARTQLAAIGMAPDRVELEVLKATLGMIPGIRLEITSPEAVLEEAGLEAM